VVGIPGHPVRIEGRRPEGPDADWVHLPDPIQDAIKALARRIESLERATGSSSAGAQPAGEPPQGHVEDEPQIRDEVNRAIGPNPTGG
jgi:serine O-acetyltransferase